MKLLLIILIIILNISTNVLCVKTRVKARHRALVVSQHKSLLKVWDENDAMAKAGEGGEGKGDEFGPCKTCVFVLERIKKGTNMLLPAICSEIYIKFPKSYGLCHQVLNALSLNGNNVRYWLFEGCYKYEIYNAKEWVKPCPSHVMCTVLKQLNNEPFCKPLPMENPFEFDPMPPHAKTF